MNMFFIFNIDIKYSGQRVHFCMNVRVKSYFGTPPHTKPEGHSFVSPRTLKVGRLQPFITIALQWDKQENLLARADFSLCFLVSQYVLTSKKYAAKHVCQQATEIMKYHFFFTWWSYNMAGRCQPPKPKLEVSHPRGWWEGWEVVCRVQPICVVFHSPQGLCGGQDLGTVVTAVEPGVLLPWAHVMLQQNWLWRLQLNKLIAQEPPGDGISAWISNPVAPGGVNIAAEMVLGRSLNCSHSSSPW